MIAVLVALGGVLLGAVSGWWARGRYAPLPRAWVVLCPDRTTAALAWRTGTMIARLDAYGIRHLTPSEIQDALADRMKPGPRQVMLPEPPREG